MGEVTRRSFVRSSAGAAAGVAGLGAFDVADAAAKGQKQRATHEHPIVAWLGDPRDGEVTIMSGNREVTIHDHALAAKIAQHVK